MKANRVFILLFFPLILFLQGCSQCSSVQPDPPSPVLLYFVDQQGNNLNALKNPILHPDSVRFSLENEPFDFLFKSPDEGLSATVFETYPVLFTKAKVDLLVHFGDQDIDTLTIAYKVSKQECYTDYTYTSFSYNGKAVQPNATTGYLKLVKQPRS